jgi:hypothetical protein
MQGRHMYLRRLNWARFFSPGTAFQTTLVSRFGTVNMVREIGKVLLDSVTVPDVLTFLLLALQEPPFCNIYPLHSSIGRSLLDRGQGHWRYGDTHKALVA